VGLSRAESLLHYDQWQPLHQELHRELLFPPPNGGVERCREGPLKSQPRPLQVPHIGRLAVVFQAQGKPASLMLRKQESRPRLRKLSGPSLTSLWIDDMASPPQVCQSLAFHCQWFLCNLSLSELQRKRS
jgi:hypothetical protein